MGIFSGQERNQADQPFEITYDNLEGHVYVTLTEQFYLAAGSCRTVYQHPVVKSLCVKVNHNPRKDRNNTEVAFFEFHGKQTLDFISPYQGMVETNLGAGVLLEIVKDYDGLVSKSLEEYIEEGVISIDTACSYIKTLEKKILQYGVLLHDDGIQNILMRKEKDGRFTPILVDGFGPRDMSFKSILRMRLRFLANYKSKHVIQGMLRRAAKTKIKHVRSK